MQRVNVEVQRKYFLNIFITELEKQRRKNDHSSHQDMKSHPSMENDESTAEIVAAYDGRMDTIYEGRRSESCMLNGIYWVLAGLTLLTEGTHMRESGRGTETMDVSPNHKSLSCSCDIDQQKGSGDGGGSGKDGRYRGGNVSDNGGGRGNPRHGSSNGGGGNGGSDNGGEDGRGRESAGRVPSLLRVLNPPPDRVDNLLPQSIELTTVRLQDHGNSDLIRQQQFNSSHDVDDLLHSVAVDRDDDGHRHDEDALHHHATSVWCSGLNEIALHQDTVVQLIQSCYDPLVGGYSAHPDYPVTVVATMSAVQCLLLLHQPQLIQRQPILDYVCSLQDPHTGSFVPSRAATSMWTSSEVDLRCALCALVILYHLGYPLSMPLARGRSMPSARASILRQDVYRCFDLHSRSSPRCILPSDSIDDGHRHQGSSSPSPVTQHHPSHQEFHSMDHHHCPPPTTWINRDSLVTTILACQNIDGGFGCSMGNESHSGYTYCAVSCLALLGQLDRLRENQRLSRLSMFLKSRVVLTDDPSAVALNGRCGKPPDVCYAWWVGASAVILDQHFHTHVLYEDPTPKASGRQPLEPLPSSLSAMASSTAEEQPPTSVMTRTSSCTDDDGDDFFRRQLVRWILSCQDQDTGGFSRAQRPSSIASIHKDGVHERQFLQSNNFLTTLCQHDHSNAATPDPFHTFFGLASLSLLIRPSGSLVALNPLAPIDPLTAFPSVCSRSAK